MEEKKEWTGQKFQRADHVHFVGNDKFKAVNTYVWTFFCHMSLSFYLIEHHDGLPASTWFAKPPFRDGFEAVHSSELQEDLKYIQINCPKEHPGETDQLILLKRD